MNGSLGHSFQSEVLVDGVALIHDLAAVPLRVRFHVGIEPLGRTGKVPVGLAPNLVCVKQRLRAGIDPLSLLTAFFEELQAQIVVTLVLVDYKVIFVGCAKSLRQMCKKQNLFRKNRRRRACINAIFAKMIRIVLSLNAVNVL